LAPNIEDTDNEICVLSDIVSLPEEVLEFVQKRVPTFKLRSPSYKRYFIPHRAHEKSPT